MVITSNMWFSLLAKVYLKLGEDEIKDRDRGSEKEVVDKHLVRSWDSIMVGGC